MTRGMRQGTLTKAVLVDRLLASGQISRETKFASDASVQQLLGHATHYKIVSKLEIEETTPVSETTMPCYLYSLISDDEDRERIDKYVVTSSRAFERGSKILNVVAQRMIGSRLIGAKVSGFNVPIRRPRFEPGRDLDHVQDFVKLWKMTHGAEDLALKHAFMPEKWGDDALGHIRGAVATHRNVLPPEPEGWRTVMLRGNTVGWDNAINRMMTRFFGNVQVKSCKGYKKSVLSYMRIVPLIGDCETRNLLIDTLINRPRPLVVTNDDYEMVMNLRFPGAPKAEFFMPENAPNWTTKVFEVYLFLTRFGTVERSYLPVVKEGRQYSYIDSKIARGLFPTVDVTMTAHDRACTEARKAIAAAKTTHSTTTVELPETPTFGSLMGFDPVAFNQRRKALIQKLRKKNQVQVKSKSFLSPNQKKKFIKAAKHRRTVGYGEMPENIRIDSMETDSFGARLIMKTKMKLDPFILPITGDVKKVKKAVQSKKLANKKISKKKATLLAMNAEEPQAADPTLQDAICAGIDEGRAKLFTATVRSKSDRKAAQTNIIEVAAQSEPVKKEKVSTASTSSTKPAKKENVKNSSNQKKGERETDPCFETVTLTRRKYNSVTKLKIRRKWENNRTISTPGLQAARNALAQGSLHSCDMNAWLTYMTARRIHAQVLDADYFADKERERWSMIAFRKKKSCLDRAVGEIFKMATRTEPISRPLVIGIGDAAFPANGPRGETAVPTSKLACAYKRAVVRERKKGRRVIILPISEMYTTLTCASCGHDTAPPLVTRRWKNREGEQKTAHGPSCRLRCCTHCSPTGKLRDRDVQAARNMLLATEAIIRGEARPAHLCAAAHPSKSNKPLSPTCSTSENVPETSGQVSLTACPSG